MPADPSELDLRIRDTVAAALSTFDGSFELEFWWSDAAGLWFTDVRPFQTGCADISVGHDGRGDLTLTIGRGHFEVWGVTDDIGLDYLSQIVGAVAEGRVVEFGRERDASLRITLADGNVVRAGALHLPLPRRRRTTRTYSPYR